MNILEHLEKKRKKDVSKIIKSENKEYSHMLKIIKAKPDATYDEINDAIINFVTLNENRTARKMSIIKLTNIQQLDKDFMLKLYRSNPDFTKIYPPVSKLQSDYDYMIQYFKICYMLRLYNEGTGAKIDNILCQYKELITDPEFLYLFSLNFSNYIILDAVKKYFNTQYGSTDPNDDKAYKKYDKFVNSLPPQFLYNLARRFGSDAISYIPNNNPDYVNILLNGIENDGFNTLSKAPIKTIQQHKILLYKAISKYNMLANNPYNADKEYMSPEYFFLKKCNPIQEFKYLEGNEVKTNKVFYKPNFDFLKDMMEDTKFWIFADYPLNEKYDILLKIKDIYNTYAQGFPTQNPNQDEPNM